MTGGWVPLYPPVFLWTLILTLFLNKLNVHLQEPFRNPIQEFKISQESQLQNLVIYCVDEWMDKLSTISEVYAISHIWGLLKDIACIKCLHSDECFALALFIHWDVGLMESRLASNFYCNHEWPQTPDPLASTSQVLSLQMCTTVPYFNLTIIIHSIYYFSHFPINQVSSGGLIFLSKVFDLPYKSNAGQGSESMPFLPWNSSFKTSMWGAEELAKCSWYKIRSWVWAWYPPKRPNMVWYTYNPNSGETEAERSLELTGQPAESNLKALPQKPKWMKDDWGWPLSSQVHKYTDVETCMYICIHTHTKKNKSSCYIISLTNLAWFLLPILTQA